MGIDNEQELDKKKSKWARAGSSVVSVRMTDEELDEVKALAAKLNLSIPSVLRLAMPTLDAQADAINLSADVINQALRPVAEFGPAIERLGSQAAALIELTSQVARLQATLTNAIDDRVILIRVAKSQSELLEKVVARMERLERVIADAVGSDAIDRLEQEAEMLAARQATYTESIKKQ
jgi:hypothetical protein